MVITRMIDDGIALPLRGVDLEAVIPRRSVFRGTMAANARGLLCKSSISQLFPLSDFAPAIFGHCSAREVSSCSSSAFLPPSLCPRFSRAPSPFFNNLGRLGTELRLVYLFARRSTFPPGLLPARLHSEFIPALPVHVPPRIRHLFEQRFHFLCARASFLSLATPRRGAARLEIHLP